MLNNLYKLPEIHFIGGSSEDLQFDLYLDEAKRQPIDLQGGAAQFSLVDFSNRTGAPIVSKEMEIQKNKAQTGHNVVYVSLSPEDTVDLFGKYVYQITLRDAGGNIDIPHQGIVMIHNNIDKAFIKDNT